MTPYVELQQAVIEWLFRIQTIEEQFLRNLLRAFRNPLSADISLVVKEWHPQIKGKGFTIVPEEGWDKFTIFRDIIFEQIDDSEPTLKIRNLLGFPLYNYGGPIGLTEWVKQRGNGNCRLRTNRFTQPGALKTGDTLVTGEKVLTLPREGGNGAVLVHLSGRINGTWLSFPARTPLALLTPEDNAPPDLIEL